MAPTTINHKPPVFHWTARQLGDDDRGNSERRYRPSVHESRKGHWPSPRAEISLGHHMQKQEEHRVRARANRPPEGHADGIFQSHLQHVREVENQHVVQWAAVHEQSADRGEYPAVHQGDREEVGGDDVSGEPDREPRGYTGPGDVRRGLRTESDQQGLPRRGDKTAPVVQHGRPVVITGVQLQTDRQQWDAIRVPEVSVCVCV